MSGNPGGDPEEGEIVDDDFEEISDNSIIVNETGKSLSPKEHLPVISLSSVSEESEDEASKMLRLKMRLKRLHHHGHHHGHHHHKWKRKMKGRCLGKHHKKKKWKRFNLSSCSSNSDSDSSFDLELDRKLHTQLKAAIQVPSKGTSNKNSLKARLRAMTRQDDNTIKIVSDNQKSDSDKVENASVDDGDDELIQLRLEALRTAVMNKFEHRKKRKVRELEGDQNKNSDNSEINKENTGNGNENENGQLKKICLEKLDVNTVCLDKLDVNTTPPEDDEDVLRALLLASMSKKITKEIDVDKVELPLQVPKPIQIIPKPKPKPTILTKKYPVPFRQRIPPKIKPIIINVNNDSDTDEDKNKSVNITAPKETALPMTKISSEIESTVERFLKEQRAKVEALLPETKPTVAVTPRTGKTNQDSVILEKSAVKLLPKIKQIEYHKLLQRLKNAQRKPRARKSSLRATEEEKPTRKIVKNKEYEHKRVFGINKMEKAMDVKQDAKTLHVTLKQMQREKDGRWIDTTRHTTGPGRRWQEALIELQIEEKFVVLTPIIRKINEVTTERKKYDQEVKRLLEELAEAKAKLYETHRNFSMYVKELVEKKEEIENRSSQQQIQNNIVTTKKPVTSTPNNRKLAPVSLEMSTVPHTPNISVSTSTLSTPIPKLSPTNYPAEPNVSHLAPDQELKASEKMPDPIPEEIVTDRLSIECESKEVVLKISEIEQVVCNGTSKDLEMSDIDDGINPGDPNDIHRMYEMHKDVLNYVSPLDSIKREAGSDPFGIMCPFDVGGNCRDPECTYKHYSR